VSSSKEIQLVSERERERDEVPPGETDSDRGDSGGTEPTVGNAGKGQLDSNGGVAVAGSANRRDEESLKK